MQAVGNISAFLSSNICRCCHSIGFFKDISTEYDSEGKELYEDLLRITFNIEISSYHYGTTQSSKQICEDCISKLEQANTFRNMVIASENTMSEYFKGLEKSDNNVTTEVVNVSIIKTELLEEEVNDPEYMENDNNDEDFDNEYVVIKEELESEPDEDDEPEKNELDRNNRKSKRHQTSEEQSQSNDKANSLKVAGRRGVGPILRHNSIQLIENSTMLVFQWNKSRYYCFFCKEAFIEISSLREHYETNFLETSHSLEETIIKQQNRLVKVDISNLNCRKCYENVTNIENLQQHLIDKHKMEFPLSANLLLPFKIQSEGLKCQICSENFDGFRLFNMHMNKHYQNYVCDVCGTSFTNLVFLNLHKSRSHKTYQCIECNITFNKKTDKKNHDITVHNLKHERKQRFPCQFCDERFFQENLKIQHLVEKHGLDKPSHKCPMCPKHFITKSLCNNHVRNVHKKERKHQCDICQKVFFTKFDVMRHRVTHTGEKKFSCDSCNTLFATKNSLTRHIKRAHVIN